jgi:hypothetical protein
MVNEQSVSVPRVNSSKSIGLGDNGGRDVIMFTPPTFSSIPSRNLPNNSYSQLYFSRILANRLKLFLALCCYIGYPQLNPSEGQPATLL